MDKSYLDDPEIREGLLQVLLAEGWFGDCAEPPFSDHESRKVPDISDISDSPEEVKRGLQKFKEQLQRNGLLEAE